MRTIKKIVPASLKLLYTVNKRRCRDLINGNRKKWAGQYLHEAEFFSVISLEQEVKANVSAENKIHNLGLAIGALNNILINPGEIFSFWHLVGIPSQKNGYQKSRSIIAGEIDAAIGGGLCQLSGLIYFLAIKAGLAITERHPHSLDIYKEEERFTPLGSDATVVYGYKDLRFVNNYPFPVCLSFQLTKNTLTGSLSAAEKMEPREIEFLYNRSGAHTLVDTICEYNGQRFVISSNSYQSLQ